MTRDEAREFAKVVQAYADGKQVQVCNADRHWFDLDDPEFFTRTIGSYRIKPEPPEWFLVVNCDGDVWHSDTTLAEAQRQCNERNAHGALSPYTVVHVREVMP